MADLTLKPHARAELEELYRARTPRSAEAMARAQRYMVRGLTRGWGYHRPYPLVAKRGEGPWLIDLDDNRYVDLANNGLSLIHGHAFPPVVEALRAAAGRGSGWLVPSEEQIEFAQMLCERIEVFERVRFTNSGTESGMLAMKVARAFTGRQAVLKSIDGFHGSFDDLEVGLYDRPEEPGRVYLAPFGDAEAFERKLAEHGDQIAAVVLEPLLFSGLVTTAPPGFLRRVQEAAQRAGALFVLDDCLMLRLAYGGSAELYGLTPDLTFLGKFIGGSLPMGVTGGRAEVMDVLDPHREQPLYHGGSFNGNLLSSVTGRVSLEHFTAETIAAMNERAVWLRGELEQGAAELGLPLTTVGEGSVLGIYLTDSLARHSGNFMAGEGTQLLHLAALTHGVFMGPGGEIALSSVVADEALTHARDGVLAAMSDVARLTSND
ncbi:MAG TPA: aminotransferase class III-fold pyridoxal phosphate-dependent enzyme [Solirubrobacteraceae bacterium]|jgi:glutamate-1-semialdehyde 2,1-aminomutase|nr:aminotransferase class III-fold pyridoxal phosphate-dependent enzyme [Solirubrobacteraceae bacterium]